MMRDGSQGDEARFESAARQLRDAYVRLDPRDKADDVARRAIAMSSGVASRRNAMPSRLRAAMAGIAGLAAAATLLVVFAKRTSNITTPATASDAVASDAAAAIAVEVPEGHDAIVFGTSNPLISVVWIH